MPEPPNIRREAEKLRKTAVKLMEQGRDPHRAVGALEKQILGRNSSKPSKKP